MKNTAKNTSKYEIKKSSITGQVLREKDFKEQKKDDSLILKIGRDFINRYRKDLQALAHK